MWFIVKSNPFFPKANIIINKTTDIIAQNLSKENKNMRSSCDDTIFYLFYKNIKYFLNIRM